ncbi:hypothetical protein ACIBCH_36650 [Amycolatopsis thailandensis]|uniref:hypothetical protein n=1 Tax=Amycolatopsis thailandensis TaxID=589330 RepID=UPI0037AE0367
MTRILNGLSLALLLLLAVVAAAAAIIPDALPGPGDRVVLGLVAMFALAGAVVFLVDLLKA